MMANPTAIGDKIEIGHYPQGADGEILPLRWLVLAVREGCALLVADKMIECMPYHAPSGNVTWESSSLRAWLNGDFFNSSFTDAEKAAIQPISLANPDNARYDIPGGVSTKDRVFLLSLPEMEEFFTFGIDRKVYATPYAVRAKNPGLADKSASAWWLRSPGGSGRHAATVHYIGGVSRYGNPVTDSHIAVRPALWVKLSS